ncbi:GNAT family N-acetyltransferase [Clostridium sp. FP2]|uniref:GNAT family N-acetyltransferase n=1 Tax=Clostridium sp. FP2 TaxID=2724481 RepID=UPI0013E93552|nr:GNAT family N-acetyltransferase [Clostridium sp. FP2]MBZ9625055.1 GNAT family N-acetyltransferase [Clostridium sp. FP2]
MTISYRKYKDKEDLIKIREFLIESVSITGPKFYCNIGNFEYCSLLDLPQGKGLESIDEALKNIYLWFEDEKLLGGISPDEDSLEFLINPNIRVPFQQMIDIGEMALKDSIEEYEKIEWWVYDGDTEIEEALIKKGYCNSGEYRPHRVFDYSVPVEIPVLPEGYYIKNLSEVSDKNSLIYIYKNCLGMPVDEKTLENFTENATYRNELDVAVMAPDHTVAAFCSGTYDEKNKMASFEAVACHSNHRCKGLTKVIMRYALQKARELGAEKSTVQTSDPKRHLAPNKLYESVGFELVGNINFWRKKI